MNLTLLPDFVVGALDEVRVPSPEAVSQTCNVLCIAGRGDAANWILEHTAEYLAALKAPSPPEMALAFHAEAFHAEAQAAATDEAPAAATDSAPAEDAAPTRRKK